MPEIEKIDIEKTERETAPPPSLPSERTKAAEARAAGLRRRAETSPSRGQGLLPDALEELNATIEELRVAEEEMRAQNEELMATRLRVEAERQRYQDLFEFAPDGYLVTALDGKILEANQAASELLGISSRFLKSRALATLVAPDNLPAYSAALKTLAAFPATTKPQEQTLRLRRRQAGLFHAAVTAVRVAPRDNQPATLRWLVRDITERRQAEEERLALVRAQAAQAEGEAAQRQVAVILDTITEMFVTLNRDWLFTYFNASAARLLRESGHDPDALLGQVIWEAFPKARGTAFQIEALRAAKTGQAVQFEEYSPSLGRWLQVRLFPSRDGVAAYSLDITRRKEAEGQTSAA